MTTMDKAVSTEDLCANEFDPALSLGLGVARLEAVLHTLVENKVEALKNENRKASSVHSSPKSILNRLRLTSTSSQSTKENEEEWASNQKHRKKKKLDHCVVDMKRIDQRVLKKEATTSSHDSRRYRCRIRSYEGSSNSEDERQRHYDNICVDNSCPMLNEKPPTCCCNREISGSIMHFDDDISLKIEGAFGDIETDAIISEEAIRRARRKRRRRRKRRMKKRLAMHHAHLVDPIEVSESYKNLTEDELSRRAKWTIVATACLLLFMCMLLVGITLRMAPIIDEMDELEMSLFLQIPQYDGRSRSSSFSCNREENVRRVRRAVSLEDILFSSRKQERRPFGKKRGKTTQLSSRRNSSKRSSSRRAKSNRSSIIYESVIHSSRNSFVTESDKHSRRSSYVNTDDKCRKPSNASYREKLLTEEDIQRSKRRKRIVTAIIVVFCFLLLTCVFSVLITLTHTSTAVVKKQNATIDFTYYTFSSHPDILCNEAPPNNCS